MRKRTQRGRFLNRYDFPCAGRNTIKTGLNTFKIIAPGLIENAGNKIDKVTEKRIAQIMREEKNSKELL